MLLVIASMIGTGVYGTSGLLLRDLPSVPAVLLVWGLGGLAALTGALTYAEAVAALPQNGGEYQLLSRIYHPSVGFTSGVVSIVVGFCAPIAATAMIFGEYLNRLIPDLNPSWSGLVLIGATGSMHAASVKVGSWAQNYLTALKLLLMALFIGGAVVFGDTSHLHFQRVALGPALVSSPFAVGLMYVSFSYSGWNASAYVAGEVKSPGRALPLAIVGGTVLVTILYVALNAAFLAAGPAETLRGVEEIGHVAAVELFGGVAGSLLTATICLGLVSTVGALVMTGTRVVDAMGRDHPRLQVLTRRTRGGGPWVAVMFTVGVASIMALAASFEWLLSYVGLTLSLFALLTVVGVFVLRLREPGLRRPYRTWGYPFTPIVFVALTTWTMAMQCVVNPVVAATSATTVAGGFLLWWIASAPPGVNRS